MTDYQNILKPFFGNARFLPVLIGIMAASLLIFLISRNSKSLFYYKFGKVYLGFLGVGVITVMDVLTSVFYAPAEAFRYLQHNALFFIVLTAGLVALYSFSMTEIAQILEGNKIIGGGVYSFSYIVFGRNISLIAASSILVDYVNTAAISSISAIENLAFSIPMSGALKIALELGIIWIITLINIIGIKENVKTTYALFIYVVFVLGITISLGAFNTTPESLNIIKSSVSSTLGQFSGKGLVQGFELIVIGVGSTILAYSGIESVLQTHRVVEHWKVIRKSYIFLIIFIGFVTPTMSFLALSQVKNPEEHTHNLITFYSQMLGGHFLNLLITTAAIVTLAFAVNTSMVASVELLISMSDRFGVKWLAKTNRFGSHYVIILSMAVFFSLIILVTNGNQSLVADMYAIGLVATFVLNLMGLIVYRYFQGFSQLKDYRTSIFKNIVLLILFIGAFVYIFIHKKFGAYLWVGSSILMVIFGIIATRVFRNPEQELERNFDKREDIFNYLETLEGKHIEIFFIKHPQYVCETAENAVFITFGLQRVIAPSKTLPHHFVLSTNFIWGIDAEIEALLGTISEKFPDKEFTVHIGWPGGSWIKRLYSGFVVHNILRIPQRFPEMDFVIEYRADKEKCCCMPPKSTEK